jgi:hypothetical protein
MNITVRAKQKLDPQTENLLEEKLAAPLRLLGEEKEQALLEIDIEEAPAEGRSSEPYRLVVNLSVHGKVYHAEAVKPTPEAAADRVRSELEQEIRKSRGRARALWKRGHQAIKDMMRFGD